jgi:hypothetical protein
MLAVFRFQWIKVSVNNFFTNRCTIKTTFIVAFVNIYPYLRIETYVGVYIYKSYNKSGFNSASVGEKLFI